MDMKCSICHFSQNTTKNFGDVDETGIKWITKLRYIVPELEQSEECLICSACIREVEGFLKFRDQLFQLVPKQKKIFLQEEDDYVENDCTSVDDQKSLDGRENDYQQQNHFQTEEDMSTANKELVPFVCETLSEKLPNIIRNETLELNNDVEIDKRYSCAKYICSLCSLNLPSEEELTTHLSFCHGEYAKNKNNTAEIVQQHICISSENEQVSSKKRRGRKSTRIFTCEICGQQFNYIKDIITHCVSTHSMERKSVKPYSCNKCCQRFNSFANYDQHQKYHDRNREYVCSLCGKGFITKSDLLVHEYTHFNRRNYKCSNCDKAFNTNKNLRTHILVVHTESSSWKYACSLCEKRFPLKSNYDQHMRRHTGDKQHVCHICKRSFVTSSELKRHIALHTNIRPFKCEYCKKDYKEIRTLKTHLKQSHSVGDAKLPQREKKYVCHICPSQFYDKQKLSRHLCSHSGLKPFACSTCDKKFTDKSYLKYHIKNFHNVSNSVM